MYKFRVYRGFLVSLNKKGLKYAYILSKCRRIWRTISTVRRRARWYRNGRNRCARRASSLCVSRTPVTRRHLAWFTPFWSHRWTKRRCFMSHPLEGHLIFFCCNNNTLKNWSELGSFQRKMAQKARFVLLFATADHNFPLISSLVTRLPLTDANGTGQVTVTCTCWKCNEFNKVQSSKFTMPK